MHCTRKINEDLYWIGGNDKRLALFENIHPIPEGTSYNSYIMLDEKTVLFDTVDWSVSRLFLDNLQYILDGRSLDYVIVNHVEPDHCASLNLITEKYPEVTVVCSKKAVSMLAQYNFKAEKIQEVSEGDVLKTGKHELTFVMAPMVHWPEAMMTFDTTDGILFSADAFGSFGTLDGRIFSDELDYPCMFTEYARRYYTNIVGKFGPQVQKVLNKAAGLDIKCICPLHGLVFRKPEDIAYILDKYTKWSTYEPEKKGVLICYASMYGNTEEAANILAALLCEKGWTEYELCDVSNVHVSKLIASAFKYSHMALLSVTYNNKVFPVMQSFIDDMQALNLQNRVVGVCESGSWAPQSGSLMKKQIAEMKNMTLLDESATLLCAVKEDSYAQVEALADALVASLKA